LPTTALPTPATLAPTMRAVVQDAYGPSETLRLAEADHIISVEPVEVPIRLLRRALTTTGTLVIVGGEGGGRWTGGTGRQMRALLLSPVVKQRLTTFISGEKHTDMERLAGFMQDGTVTPAVGQRYSLERAPQALADLEAGRARGKAVVVVRQA